jgi:hypothetical protein
VNLKFGLDKIQHWEIKAALLGSDLPEFDEVPWYKMRLVFCLQVPIFKFLEV